MLDHVSKYGKKSAFSDDSFTAKKILPGYKPQKSDLKWGARLQVSQGSFYKMMLHVCNNHEPQAGRGCKKSKESLEKLAEMAAFVHNMEEEVTTNKQTHTHTN